MLVVNNELNHFKYEFAKKNYNIFYVENVESGFGPDTDRQALDADADSIIYCASDRLHVF
jgi:hypothetical protein